MNKAMKVLIVDDMLTMRKIVKKCLTENGFTNVCEADDGETAVGVLEREEAGGDPVKIVLSDWNMPKMKGVDLLRWVRANPNMKSKIFILVTAGCVCPGRKIGTDIHDHLQHWRTRTSGRLGRPSTGDETPSLTRCQGADAVPRACFRLAGKRAPWKKSGSCSVVLVRGSRWR